MRAIITHPSWHQIDKACAVLAGKINRVDHSKSAIVGLARGGLVPSVIISHILGLKVFPISYSSKKGQGEYKDYDNVLPKIPINTIWLIDDIIDSGNSMKEIHDHYFKAGHNMFSASLYYKTSSIFRPNLYWQEIPAESNWICFPWEI
jgi:hypoxanthine phosphoribosyltransferase